LFRSVSLRENGEKRRMLLAEVIVHDLIHSAAKGDPKARRDLLELLKRYPRAAKPRPEIPKITADMSVLEAQKAYEETLRNLNDFDDIDRYGVDL
jgi:hypothetical protein